MKSGNHTIAPQWLYILINLPYLWVVKIGIGGNLKARERQVDKSAPGIDLIIFAVWIPYAYSLEQAIHRLCKPLRVRFRGSGRTERFLLPAALVAIPAALVAFVLWWGSLVVFCYLIISAI